MDFLCRATTYTEARGDHAFFAWVYENHRASNNVADSVRKTLSYLYGNEVSDLLEFQRPVA